MARGDYTPEIRAAIGDSPKGRINKSPPKPSPNAPAKKVAPNDPGDTPADMARDRARGIKEDSPQDQKIDMSNMPMQHMMPGMPPDAHHVNAAAGIAHAILGKRGMM